MLFRARLIAPVAAGLIAATSSPSISAASPGDACALLTSGQVSAAVKAPVGPGSYVMPTYKKTCTWTAPHSTNGVKIVTVSFEGLNIYDAGKRAGGGFGASAAALRGIGDEAYYLTTGTLVSLHIKKGSNALKVAVYATAPAEQIQAMEKALAQTVVTNL